jgi:hypothetical protein
VQQQKPGQLKNSCLFTDISARLPIFRQNTPIPHKTAIHKAERARIAKILVPTSQGRHNDETVGVVLKAAATSIGTATPAKEVVLKQMALILLQLEDH